MIGCSLLSEIHSGLVLAKYNSNSFGGMNMIFFGDFYQLPPVGDLSLYTPPNKLLMSNPSDRNIHSTGGRGLWTKLNESISLIQQMRQEDAIYAQLLQRLRNGNCTRDDYALLQNRIIGRVDGPKLQDFSNVPFITITNKVRVHVNKLAANKTGTAK